MKTCLNFIVSTTLLVMSVSAPAQQQYPPPANGLPIGQMGQVKYTSINTLTAPWQRQAYVIPVAPGAAVLTNKLKFVWVEGEPNIYSIRVNDMAEKANLSLRLSKENPIVYHDLEQPVVLKQLVIESESMKLQAGEKIEISALDLTPPPMNPNPGPNPGNNPGQVKQDFNRTFDVPYSSKGLMTQDLQMLRTKTIVLTPMKSITKMLSFNLITAEGESIDLLARPELSQFEFLTESNPVKPITIPLDQSTVVQSFEIDFESYDTNGGISQLKVEVLADRPAAPVLKCGNHENLSTWQEIGQGLIPISGSCQYGGTKTDFYQRLNNMKCIKGVPMVTDDNVRGSYVRSDDHCLPRPRASCPAVGIGLQPDGAVWSELIRGETMTEQVDCRPLGGFGGPFYNNYEKKIEKRCDDGVPREVRFVRGQQKASSGEACRGPRNCPQAGLNHGQEAWNVVLGEPEQVPRRCEFGGDARDLFLLEQKSVCWDGDFRAVPGQTRRQDKSIGAMGKCNEGARCAAANRAHNETWTEAGKDSSAVLTCGANGRGTQTQVSENVITKKCYNNSVQESSARGAVKSTSECVMTCPEAYVSNARGLHDVRVNNNGYVSEVVRVLKQSGSGTVINIKCSDLINPAASPEQNFRYECSPQGEWKGFRAKPATYGQPAIDLCQRRAY